MSHDLLVQVAYLPIINVGSLSAMAEVWKTEHFMTLAENDNTSSTDDHVKTTGHNIKWDHFDILEKGKADYHCKIKET